MKSRKKDIKGKKGEAKGKWALETGMKRVKRQGEGQTPHKTGQHNWAPGLSISILSSRAHEDSPLNQTTEVPGEKFLGVNDENTILV